MMAMSVLVISMRMSVFPAPAPAAMTFATRLLRLGCRELFLKVFQTHCADAVDKSGDGLVTAGFGAEATQTTGPINADEPQVINVPLREGCCSRYV